MNAADASEDEFDTSLAIVLDDDGMPVPESRAALFRVFGVYDRAGTKPERSVNAAPGDAERSDAEQDS